MTPPDAAVVAAWLTVVLEKLFLSCCHVLLWHQKDVPRRKQHSGH